MTSAQQAKKQPNYIECSNCSMNSICKPVEKKSQALDLSVNYLDKRVSISSVNTTTPSKEHHRLTHGVLFKKSDPLTTIYAVCSGAFKLCEPTEDGNDKIVGLRYPGELIGEDALFLKKYNYTAIAIGNSSVCKVSVEQLTSCGKLVPELQQNLIHLLSKQSYVRQTNFQAFIGKKSADSLLAAFLINVTERNAAHSGNKNTLTLAISRNDIANFLGLRRETLSRVFTKFQNEQLVNTEGKLIHLLEKEKLSELANFHPA